MSYLMIVVVNLVQVASTLLTVYMWVVIISALISWVNPDPYNPIVRFIHNATEPVLRVIRSRVPAIEGIDISPIIVFLAIIFLQYFVVESLLNLAHYLM